jgi:hypothetical protein
MNPQDMTEFERGQLMHWHFEGQPAYRNEQRHKYPAPAFRRMFDRFLAAGLVDTHSGRLNPAGEALALELHESRLPCQSVGL